MEIHMTHKFKHLDFQTPVVEYPSNYGKSQIVGFACPCIYISHIYTRHIRPNLLLTTTTFLQYFTNNNMQNPQYHRVVEKKQEYGIAHSLDGSNVIAIRCRATCDNCDDKMRPPQTTLMKCGRCKNAYYCSRRCQRQDFADHAHFCF